MSEQMLLLKPAVRVESEGHVTVLQYRGQRVEFHADDARVFSRCREELAGTTGRTALTRGIVGSAGVIQQLENVQMVVEVAPVDAGLLSGERAFWELEADLCRLKFGSADPSTRYSLDLAIASGSVRREVAEGFLIELGYLMRHVPHELSLAVSTAPDDEIRRLYTQFFVEECDHGQMMFAELRTWYPAEQLVAMRPLPSTVAVLNLYASMASAGPLTYGAALMHDESSPLDPVVTPDEDPYVGMTKHYQLPENVVKVFHWHAELDRHCDHGFFPLEIFRAVRFVDQDTLAVLRQRLLTLFETRVMWRREVAEFYGTRSVLDRLPA